MTGNIIAWNRETQRGIIECSLDGRTYQFDYGHAFDRACFVEGMRVTFDLEGITALNVEAASGSFLRYAAVYTPT